MNFLIEVRTLCWLVMQIIDAVFVVHDCDSVPGEVLLGLVVTPLVALTTRVDLVCATLFRSASDARILCSCYSLSLLFTHFLGHRGLSSGRIVFTLHSHQLLASRTGWLLELGHILYALQVVLSRRNLSYPTNQRLSLRLL